LQSFSLERRASCGFWRGDAAGAAASACALLLLLAWMGACVRRQQQQQRQQKTAAPFDSSIEFDSLKMTRIGFRFFLLKKTATTEN
jgi:hypothetical protein